MQSVGNSIPNKYKDCRIRQKLPNLNLLSIRFLAYFPLTMHWDFFIYLFVFFFSFLLLSERQIWKFKPLLVSWNCNYRQKFDSFTTDTVFSPPLPALPVTYILRCYVSITYFSLFPLVCCKSSPFNPRLSHFNPRFPAQLISPFCFLLCTSSVGLQLTKYFFLRCQLIINWNLTEVNFNRCLEFRKTRLRFDKRLSKFLGFERWPFLGSPRTAVSSEANHSTFHAIFPPPSTSIFYFGKV